MIRSREEFEAHLRFGEVKVLGFHDLPDNKHVIEYFGTPFEVGLPPLHERQYPPRHGSMRCALVSVREGKGDPMEWAVPAEWVLEFKPSERKP